MSDSKPIKKPFNGEGKKELSQFFNDSAVHQRVTYQFLCSKCHHITEEEFEFGNPNSSVKCQTPECNGYAHKIISTPGILTGIPIHEARKGRGKG